MISSLSLRRLVSAGAVLCLTACTKAVPEASSAESAAPTADDVASAAASTPVALSPVFGAFDITPAAPGVLATQGAWHLVADTGATRRVYLMHRITAIALPPGPVTATEPVTLIQYTDSGWRMLPTVAPAPAVPAHIIAALTPALTDTTRTYAFLVRTFDVTNAAPSMIGQLRGVRAAMETESAALLATGFISADAEP
jgi:hypothetical protein